MDKETLKIVLFCVAGAVLFMIPVMLVLYGYQKYKEAGRRSLERILQEFLSATDVPPAEDPVVSISFYTYQGFLNTSIETHHALSLPCSQARRLLKKLHVFNLKWGWWGLGGLFIPLISWSNYRTQLRSIRKQLAEKSACPEARSAR